MKYILSFCIKTSSTRTDDINKTKKTEIERTTLHEKKTYGQPYLPKLYNDKKGC